MRFVMWSSSSGQTRISAIKWRFGVSELASASGYITHLRRDEDVSVMQIDREKHSHIFIFVMKRSKHIFMNRTVSTLLGAVEEFP